MKFFLAAILINFLLSFNLHSQSIEETYQFGNHQLTLGNYNNAISSYRRVLFFDDGSYKGEIFSKLAKCYKLSGEYTKAHKYYDLAYFNTQNDSLRNEYILKKVYLYILNKEYNYAHIEILNAKTHENDYFRYKINFYKGIINFHKKQYELAHESFKSCFDVSEIEIIDKLNILFQDNKKIDNLNPKVARYLSVIPGVGQLYSGYPREALNSFMLTTGLLILYSYTIFNYSLVDGMLAVLPWFQRYYLGGLEKAENLAKYKIEYEKNIIYTEILRLFHDRNDMEY